MGQVWVPVKGFILVLGLVFVLLLGLKIDDTITVSMSIVIIPLHVLLFVALLWTWMGISLVVRSPKTFMRLEIARYICLGLVSLGFWISALLLALEADVIIDISALWALTPFLVSLGIGLCLVIWVGIKGPGRRAPRSSQGMSHRKRG